MVTVWHMHIRKVAYGDPYRVVEPKTVETVTVIYVNIHSFYKVFRFKFLGV